MIDHIPGRLELPCTYTYSTTDEGLCGQLVELVSYFMESYRIRIQKLDAKNTKKKKNKRYAEWTYLMWNDMESM